MSALRKAWLWARLALNEAIYWFVGTTPESHYATAAYLWHELGRHRRSIAHCKRYLAHTHSDPMVALCAYGHTELDEWTEAVAAYRSLTEPLKDPLNAMALAYAELQLGNAAEARAIVATVEAVRGQLSDIEVDALDYVQSVL